MGLNKRQALFVEHYLISHNATQAAIAAGYSKKTARQIGARLLTKVDIAARVAQRTESVMTSLQMQADEVLERMAAIARGNISQFLDVSRGEPYFDLSKQGAPLHLIKRIKTKRSAKFGDETELEMYDAQSALVTIGKHWKLWDRASEIDWRKAVNDLGLNPGDLFEQMVQQAAQRIKQAKAG